MDMIAYYDKKEAIQKQFDELEKRLIQSLKNCDVEKNKKINKEYDALLIEYRALGKSLSSN